MTKGSQIRYSQEELAYIEHNCTLPRKDAYLDFCEKFGRDDVSFLNFKALCTRKGWKTGRTGFYEKGLIPYNKGKEMAFNANSAATQFKKGNKPHNTKYLEHERITKDGYIEISIDEKNPHTGYETRYQLKHKYLWEKQNGKVPKGMCLKCLDGNRQNADPSNWEIISRGALPFLNGHRGYNYEKMPTELKPSVLILAKVKHAKNKVRQHGAS